jgi:hypothetical protein
MKEKPFTIARLSRQAIRSEIKQRQAIYAFYVVALTK